MSGIVAAHGRAAARRIRLVPWRAGVVGAVIWLAAAALTALWPDADDLGPHRPAGCDHGGGGRRPGRRKPQPNGLRPAALRNAGPWLVALALWFLVWELITAKLDLLPRPFFTSPQSMVEVFTDDWPRLGESVLRSLWLLLPATLLGAAGRVHHRRGGGMVAGRGLLGAPAAAPDRGRCRPSPGSRSPSSCSRAATAPAPS